MQYLAFGFPLSLNEPETLGNKAIKNHISALQYPETVDRYLAKELEVGAIIGPMSDINNFHIHCSPLLTRPSLSWYKLQLDFLPVEFEILPDWTFYHDIYIYTYASAAAFIRFRTLEKYPNLLDCTFYR